MVQRNNIVEETNLIIIFFFYNPVGWKAKKEEEKKRSLRRPARIMGQDKTENFFTKKEKKNSINYMLDLPRLERIEETYATSIHYHYHYYYI